MDDKFSVDDLEIAMKNRAPRDNSEFKIHVAIVDHIRGHIRRGREISRGTMPFPGMFITHIYQGRSEEEGFFLKMLGVVSGVPDLLAIWPDRVRGYDFGFLEVKRPSGVESTPQRRFKGFCHHLGIKWAIVRSVEQAHKQFITWGLKPTHNAIKEPDTRTQQQKFKDAMEVYRP